MPGVPAESIVVIGGGLAGLATANALADAGCQPVVVESGEYPMHRVCGEFFSPECVEQLQDWGVRFPVRIRKARFIAGNIAIEFLLPKPAGGLSRYACDMGLVRRIRHKGIQVMDQTRVQMIEGVSSETGHRLKLQLSNNTTLESTHVIVATGRYSALAQHLWKPFPPGPTPLMGLKMHMQGVDLDDVIEMHVGPAGYVGLSPIEDGRWNIACLAKSSAVLKRGGPQNFVQSLMKDRAYPLLESRLKSATPCLDRWMTCGIPPFGIRQIPRWENVYFVGDCHGAITPVCGDGLSMAVRGGRMAAQHLTSGHWSRFEGAWRRQFKSPIAWGNGIQRILFSTLGLPLIARVCRSFPKVPIWFFKHTR
jgi:flavin-dependent dehydrogenase